MFEVGKKYTTASKTDPRECLKVTDEYVLLDAQKKFPHSRPLSVEKVHWAGWIEYKEPLRAKTIYIPVIQWNKSESKPVIAVEYAGYRKEDAKRYVERCYPDYILLDIIEITWEEK